MERPITEIAALIPDKAARLAWIAAGMPTDLATVASLVIKVRKERAIKASNQPRVSAAKVQSRISTPGE